jgi:phenylacetate-CoA ligase
MPRLLDLEGRRPVLFRADDGSLVNPVDISRVLREFPLVQHTFHQHADSTCELRLRPIPGLSFDADAIARALYALLGAVTLVVRVDPALGDRADEKATTFQSDLLLED